MASRKPTNAGVPHGSKVTDPDYEFCRDARIQLRQNIAEAAIQFERDFYVMSEEELHGTWMGPMRPVVENLIRPQVPPPVQAAIEKDLEGHYPLWEYLRAFFYDGDFFDQETQAKVPKEDFFLHPPLHYDKIVVPLQDYLLSPPDPFKTGKAIFITRYGLKTYIMVATAAWLLTRHRIVFDDYTTLRFIHDVEGDAIKRTERIKNKFRTHTRLRGLYPEVEIPKGPWGTQEEWDLQGRDTSGEDTLDPQVKAIGIRSVKQGAHPQYTFIDDVENENHINSPASRRETRTLFGALSYSAQIGLSKTVLAGTFYTPLGVHAQIVEMAKERVNDVGDKIPSPWDIVHIPAAYDWDKSTEVLTYPTRLSHDIIQAKLQESIDLWGDDLFARMQLFLDFQQSGRVEFNMAQWNTLSLENPASPWERKILEALRGAPVFIQMDTAWKNPLSEGGKGAATAILAMAYPRIEGVVHRVCLDAIYDDALTLTEGCHQALNMAESWKAWYIMVEEPGQKTNAPTLSDLSKQRGLKYRIRLPRLGSGYTEGNIIPVVPRKIGDGGQDGKMSAWKMSRFKRLQAVWNEGRIYLADSIPFLPSLRSELLDFPFGRVDWLDAMALSDDERVQAIIPQNKVSLPSRYRHRPQRQTIQLTKYTGLTHTIR